MVNIEELFVYYVVLRGLTNYSNADVVKYGLPLAVGSFLIHYTSPEAYVKRLLKKVIP